MSDTYDFESIHPGAISALLFIFMDIIIIGLLDVVLARIVCFAYYRRINSGKPIVVKSADIPGLSHYLIGSRWTFVNLTAVLIKVTVLAIIFLANININDKGTYNRRNFRHATFDVDPTDNLFLPNRVYTVNRRYQRSKSCFVDFPNLNHTLIFYRIRFNLANDIKLENDYGSEPTNTTAQYDIEDSSIICMNPKNVTKPDMLATVIGCSRAINNRCFSVVSDTISKNITGLKYETKPYYDGNIVSQYRNYDERQIQELFSEYDNPQFTCISTDLEEATFQGTSYISYTQCLLITFNQTDPKNETTIVERWIVSRDASTAETDFRIVYPGVVFSGIFNFSRRAAARYLSTPFPVSDYRSLSGDLLSQASTYRSIKDNRTEDFDVIIQIPINGRPVTTIYKYVVGLLIACVIIVIVALLITSLLLRTDTRPRFNTINGLSSIVREEFVPSGRSYSAGSLAILGLRFTRDDKMRFGPLRRPEDAQKLQDGYDLS